MNTVGTLPPASSPQFLGDTHHDLELRRVAEEFEASFIAEMLKHSGMNKVSGSFGGGPGEEAFASFLTEAYADQLVAVGGIGLAEPIFQAMVGKGENQ